NLLPGSGAGSLDTVIQMYMAWGRSFIVILDSDKGGSRERDRYREKFGAFVGDRVFDLSDIERSWKKKSTEGLFTDAEKLRIQQSAYPAAAKYNKKIFNRAVQEACITSAKPKLSDGTKKKFEKIFDFAED